MYIICMNFKQFGTDRGAYSVFIKNGAHVGRMLTR